MTRRIVALVCVLSLAPLASGAGTLVVDANTVHPVSGPPIRDGRIVIEDGRIARVGPAADTPAPEGARVVRGAVATPGLVDVHTSVGLAGIFNVAADRDEDEKTATSQPDLRALDSFNPREPLLRHQLEHGVTVVQASPGPANVVAGQAGIFRTHGRTADGMAVRAVSALVVNLGESPKRTYAQDKGPPGTRMGTAAILRRAFLGGREYAAGRTRADRGDDEKPPKRSLGREALARAAAGDLPVIFVAERADDIATAIRIAREWNLRFALAGASEGYLVSDLLREAGAPVLVGPVMQRVERPETLNASLENAARLERAGVRVAIRSGFESYVPRTRLVLFEAAVAAANGMGFDAALRAITLGAAEVLGIDDRFGSLEKGKAGDVVLYDADPFEYTSHVTRVIIDGELVHERRP